LRLIAILGEAGILLYGTFNVLLFSIGNAFFNRHGTAATRCIYGGMGPILLAFLWYLPVQVLRKKATNTSFGIFIPVQIIVTLIVGMWVFAGGGYLPQMFSDVQVLVVRLMAIFG
jgi:hypothetical protein